MRFIQLGNGGGLNPLMTNSSFLVEININEYLLFDCGFNVMQRLTEIENNPSNEFSISQIRHVFISHIHDDHVGNIETLMFWNYFKNNVKMKFYCANDDVTTLLQLKLNSKLYSGGKVQDIPFFKKIVRMNSYDKYIINKNVNINLKVLQNTYHGDTESNGLVILDKKYGALVITGDTKASSLLENEIKEITKDRLTKIFHDKSNWNAPSKNVHACESDINAEYSEDFINSLTYYHTGSDDFNKEWQNI